jgi:membrane protein YqaA with SNARE-associated domain
VIAEIIAPVTRSRLVCGDVFWTSVRPLGARSDRIRGQLVSADPSRPVACPDGARAAAADLDALPHCTVASSLGAVVGYVIGYGLWSLVGARLVELYGYGEGFTAYQHLIEQWGAWIIIAKSLTPIPFKIMAIAAGVAAMSPSAFLASAVLGRALHFAIVATLIALWGERVMALVSRYGRVFALFSVLLLLGLAVAYHP